jgi:hypothetical protein
MRFPHGGHVQEIPAHRIVFSSDMASWAFWEREGPPAYRKKSANRSWRAKVQTGGLVKFKQQRIQLDLPKGTYVVVLREGQDYLFYLGDQVVFRMTGQEKYHPCI